MSTMSDTEFEAACAYVRGAAGRLDKADLLYLYARYKQATEGVCSTAKPAFYQLAEKSKWQAWTDLKSMGQDQAKLEYIERLDSLHTDWRHSQITDPTASSWVSVSCPQAPAEEELPEAEKTVWDRVKEGHADKLRPLLNAETLALTDANGLTVLHWAADRGHLEAARLIISAGRSIINQQDEDGQSALHYAASCGHASLVRLLLSEGADPTILDTDGCTPGSVAADAEIKQIFQEFSQASTE